MIIDADVHISPSPEEGMSITVDELLRTMDRAGIDMAIVWPHPPYLRRIDESNKYIYRAMTLHRDRILGFGWVDPRLGVKKAIDTIRTCFEEYGFYGIKLNGSLNSFYIDDPELSLPVIEEIAKAGKVLAFHIGTDAYEQTHPFRVGKVAERFPELNILMVHMGGVGFFDLTNAAIEFAQQHLNLTLVGSAVRTNPILKAIRLLGSKRVCFGSDMPYELMHVELARYNALLDGEVSTIEKQDIMGNNIMRLLRL